MLPFSINIIPLLLTAITSFGVLLHDTRIDRAFVTTPTSGYVSTENTLRNDDHTHSDETVADNLRDISSSQPRLQTRFTDEKKYLTPKKVFLNTTFNDLS